MKIFFVLPAYNEEKNLPQLIKNISQTCRKHKFNYQIIVVDDGSNDSTSKIAKKLINYHLKLVRHKNNKGLGEAITTGFKTAIKRAGDNDLIITMDADNTHDLRSLPLIVDKFLEGYDLILASRFVKGGGDQGISPLRKILSRQAGRIFQIVFPISGVREYTCSYRGYRTSLLKKAFEKYRQGLIREKGFNCMLEILVKLSRLKAKITEVPFILYYDRKKGESKMNLKKTLFRYLTIIFNRNHFPS